MSDVTRILESIQHGDPKAADELLPLVYAELRKLAAYKMANSAAGHTLQPTALVHEVWLRLVGSENPTFENRAHFFAAAAEAMRHLLIDNARRKLAQRHGGGLQRVDVENVPFLVIQLKIQVLPCIISFINGIGVDRVVGFEDLGNTDGFSTAKLEYRLIQTGSFAFWDDELT